MTDLEDKLKLLLKKEKRKYRKDLTTIGEVSQELSSIKNLNEILERALEILLTNLNLSSGVIYLTDEVKGSLNLMTHRGLSLWFANTLNVLFEKQTLSKLTETNQVITVTNLTNDVNIENQISSSSDDIRYLVTVLLKSRRRFIGVMYATSNKPIKLSITDTLFLETLAGQIAIAIDYALLLDYASNQSITDELTGLYNRRHFSRVLETEIYRSQRYDWPVSLIMLDIDYLKSFNDKFGHVAADDLLKSLAKTLTSQSRKTDISFRLGGDEFAVILPDADSIKARGIISRVHSKWVQLQKEQNIDMEVPVEFSSGIVEFPSNAEMQDSLVFLADAALYYSKKTGRHKTTLVSELKSMAAEDSLSDVLLDQIYSLSVTVETKEAFGFGHFRRVASISEAISNEMDLPNKEVEKIKTAALLHDIGKIGIPNVILSKPDKLTPKEYELIKKHVTEGAKIVGQIGKIAEVAPLILYHHERYDGLGYPDKLKGDEIPLGARIISIADAYDSMVTPRPYRASMSPQEATQELEHFSGSQFDPTIIKAAINVIVKNTSN